MGGRVYEGLSRGRWGRGVGKEATYEKRKIDLYFTLLMTIRMNG